MFFRRNQALRDQSKALLDSGPSCQKEDLFEETFIRGRGGGPYLNMDL